MAERPDKRSRKEILDRWRAEQRAAARAKLPMSDSQMREMFAMLNAELTSIGCEHELTLVRHWLEVQGLPFDPVEAWLNEHGGYCDCTALANSKQAWQEAIHDVDW